MMNYKHFKYQVFVISYLGHMRKLCSISQPSYDLGGVRRLLEAKQHGAAARLVGCQLPLFESFSIFNMAAPLLSCLPTLL